MIRRPPRSTLDRSSAASDVYKRQGVELQADHRRVGALKEDIVRNDPVDRLLVVGLVAVSYTHLRAHETVLDLVCRLLLEKKKTQNNRGKIAVMTDE